MDTVESILAALRLVCPNREKTYQLHEPSFSGNEWNYVKECIDTGWVSSAGAYVERLEHELCTYTGSQYCIPTVNGTAALHLALLAAGVTAGDEVLLPPLTFVATGNAVLQSGGTPHFVDVESTTLGVCPVRLQSYLQEIGQVRNSECWNRNTNRKISALILVHVFGHPALIDEIQSICSEWNITLIEDAAEAIGSLYRNQHVGTFGEFGILSFNGNKTITAGAGGAILTNNAKKAQWLKHISTTAKKAHPWRLFHDEQGYNYRMPNINAALLVAQLEKIESIVAIKREIYEQYAQAFNNVHGTALLHEPPNCRSNYWLQTLILLNSTAEYREILLNQAYKEKLFLRPCWDLLSSLPYFDQYPKGPLDTALQMSTRIVNLPASVSLLGEQDEI